MFPRVRACPARLSGSIWLQVIAFLRKKDKFISLVLKHIGTSALMDLLLRLVSCVEPAGLRQEVLHVSVWALLPVCAVCGFSACGLSAWHRVAGVGGAALRCPAPSFPPSRTFPPGWTLRGSHGGLCLRRSLSSAPFLLSCLGPFMSRAEGGCLACASPPGGC